MKQKERKANLETHLSVATCSCSHTMLDSVKSKLQFGTDSLVLLGYVQFAVSHSSGVLGVGKSVNLQALLIKAIIVEPLYTKL